MATRHEGPIPEGKQRCRRCEGWGVTHYSVEEIGKPVGCSDCGGLGITDAPSKPVYPTADEQFDGWLSDRTHGLYTDEEEALARAAWKAAQERYGDGY
jgi:hypothetical protein